MGKDLQGNELGKGCSQRKDGRYNYRKTVNGLMYNFYAFNLDELIKKSEIIQEHIDTDKIGYVYFLSDGKYCKIGHTIDIEKRIKSLQTGNSTELTILKIVPTIDYVNVEKQFHDIFSRYLINGEWYDILFLFEDNNSEKPHNKQTIKPKDSILTIPEIMGMTKFGEKKVREMLKSPESNFTIKNGNRLYAHRELLEQHLKQCANYQLTI